MSIPRHDFAHSDNGIYWCRRCGIVTSDLEDTRRCEEVMPNAAS